jgi:hypothetical protein
MMKMRRSVAKIADADGFFFIPAALRGKSPDRSTIVMLQRSKIASDFTRI